MSRDGDIWASMSWPAGWDVRHVAETGSTNADLIAEVEAGTAGNRTVLAADHQTAGRGRLDRRWEAPAGANLLVSIVVAPVPAVPAEATHRIGIAAVRAARRFMPAGGEADVELKWPNDVLLGGRKLAGILAVRAATGDAVVVGIGINVGWSPEGAAALGAHLAPAEVLAAVLDELSVLPDDIEEIYRSELATIGRRVRVELPGGRPDLHGLAVDVDRTGRLVVADDAGSRHVLDVGDVVHVRAEGSRAAPEPDGNRL